VNPKFLERIWHVGGTLPLAPGQSHDEAFTRLMPLFQEKGTSYARTGDTLTFRKKDQAAQDRMSVFDGGELRIERGPGGSVLRYRLASRALLFCFLAPLLFLGFAQLTIALDAYEKASATATATPKAEEKKDRELPQHFIDKALGAPAPAPEKPDPDKSKSSEDDGPSPTPAYVFAALFAALYIVGRILEDRLVKSLFRKNLQAQHFSEADCSTSAPMAQI
jgi:hypothetical protein